MKKNMKRIIGLLFGVSLLLFATFPAFAAYSHFETSIVSEGGFYVGADGSEIEAIGADGTLYIKGSEVTSTAADINTLTGVASQFIVYQVEDLAANGDISARPLFVCPAGFTFTLSSINIIAQGSAAGIDDTNTCVVAALNGTNTIVTKTYNASVAFPTDGTAGNLGTLHATYKVLEAGDILKFSITNGSTANPPAFIIQVVGELATVTP